MESVFEDDSTAPIIMSRLYPIFADLSGRLVVVAGGGSVAERKVRALADTGATLRVVAPSITPGLQALAHAGAVEWRHGRCAPASLDDAWLVVAATDNPDLNREIAAAARDRRLFVNVVDDAELSSFHVPAVVNRRPVQVAISSGGAAPGLAAWIREWLEAALDESLGPLAALLARWRQRIKVALPNVRERRRFYHRLVTGAVGAAARNRQFARAEREIKRALTQWQNSARMSTGRVALVGAGPGDAGLITLAGLRRLKQADVILHDRLVSDEVLALARADARRIAVGKQPGDRTHTQDRINALMALHANAGRFVVRLKGGDPLIFGRGGEELEYLRATGIDYEVVPGVTAASACAAYAGIPLTHRSHARAVRLVTARSSEAIDWAALADDSQTLAVYMGVREVDTVTRNLLAHGRAADTPVAIVENGTRPEQRVVTGELARLPALVRMNAIAAPSIVIIGSVAALAPRLAWFGTGVAAPRRLAVVSA